MSIKRAVSLYSYQENFYLGKLDLEGCIREAAKTGATGIELIPEQNCCDEYLDPSRAFVSQWHEWMAKYNTVPVACDIFYDYKLYPNRMLTDMEQVKMYEQNIRFAAKLGFPIVRAMIVTPLRIIEKIVPIAEEYNVKFGVELHSPYSLKGEYTQKLFALADKLNTKHLGLIPDTGVFVKQQSRVIINKFIRGGANPDIADFLCKCYEEKMPQTEAYEKMRAMNPNATDEALYKRIYFANYDNPEWLLDDTDKIFHIHGKCWHIEEDYTDASIDNEAVISVLKRSTYDGYIATEYEGQRYFHDMGCEENADEIEEVRRHQEMLKRLLG